MTAKDAIKYMLKTNRWLLQHYLSDLSDADLLVRPVPGANHIAWQLGHTIYAEAEVFGPKMPNVKRVTLPEGFVKQHAKDMANSTTNEGFLSKSAYMEIAGTVRSATYAALDTLTESDFDRDSNMGWGDKVPTVASIFITVANHDLMHAGQFTVIRRALGKPVLF